MVSARTRPLAVACVLALASGAAQPVRGATPAGEEREAGAVGGPGLAILTAKALTAELDGRQFVDHAVILVKDGKIEAVGPRDSTEVPAGYARERPSPPRSARSRFSTIRRASFSLATTSRRIPGSGTELRPITSTTSDGPAVLTEFP